MLSNIRSKIGLAAAAVLAATPLNGLGSPVPIHSLRDGPDLSEFLGTLDRPGGKPHSKNRVHPPRRGTELDLFAVSAANACGLVRTGAKHWRSYYGRYTHVLSAYVAAKNLPKVQARHAQWLKDQERKAALKAAATQDVPQ